MENWLGLALAAALASPAQSLAADAGPQSACSAPPGGRAGTVNVDGRVANRFLSEGIGQGRWASWESDRWLQFPSDCRTVGLRLAGGGGSLISDAHFDVAEGQPPASAAEQQVLLEWAAAVVVTKQDPMALLAKLPALPGGPEVRRWDQERRAPFVRCARPITLTAAGGQKPMPLPRDVWFPDQTDPSDVRYGSGSPHCPCFKRFQGSALRRAFEIQLPLARQLLALHSGFRNDSFVIGVADNRSQTVRWLTFHGGVVRGIGAFGDWVWLSATGLLTDVYSPTYLVALNTQTLAAQGCRVLGGSLGRVEADANGIRFTAESDDGDGRRLFSWRELKSELAAARLRPRINWRPVVEGVEYAEVQVLQHPDVGDGKFHLVRIDPTIANFTAAASTVDGTTPRTAAQWSRERSMPIVFNAGMFEEDHRTHTGLFRFGSHINSEKWLNKYKSVLAARWVEGAKVELLDAEGLDFPELDEDRSDLVVQSLRLIRRPGQNVWPQNSRKWSEVALAVTSTNDIIVIFSRTPLSMHDFNERVLGLGLSIEAAMHLEGGPEASLSIHGGGIDLDLAGSYETGFREDDSNQRQWPIPNILGVAPRAE